MEPVRVHEYSQLPEILQELYEFRRAIEVPAARLTAERRTVKLLNRVVDVEQSTD
jgi:GntR family transcriptional regulator, transcriptional repressor for pyruvate dehydrogenase complex